MYLQVQPITTSNPIELQQLFFDLSRRLFSIMGTDYSLYLLEIAIQEIHRAHHAHHILHAHDALHTHDAPVISHPIVPIGVSSPIQASLQPIPSANLKISLQGRPKEIAIALLSHVDAFFEQRCILGPQHSVLKVDLKEAFEQFLDTPNPIKDAGFKRMMNMLGHRNISSGKQGNYIAYRGLALKNQSTMMSLLPPLTFFLLSPLVSQSPLASSMNFDIHNPFSPQTSAPFNMTNYSPKPSYNIPPSKQFNIGPSPYYAIQTAVSLNTNEPINPFSRLTYQPTILFKQPITSPNNQLITPSKGEIITLSTDQPIPSSIDDSHEEPISSSNDKSITPSIPFELHQTLTQKLLNALQDDAIPNNSVEKHQPIEIVFIVEEPLEEELLNELLTALPFAPTPTQFVIRTSTVNPNPTIKGYSSNPIPKDDSPKQNNRGRGKKSKRRNK